MCNGNRLRAAQILGLGRTSLYRYLKRNGCDDPVRTHTSGAAS
jgi:transcriptional regulator of acetoin/glycerol metabolism